jgi:N-acetylneuraminate synthase
VTDNSIHLAGRAIGPGHPPYVVAEISANHNGVLADALKIIELAKQAGADAVKIQTYRPDTITIDCDKPEFQIQGGLWDGHSLYELYLKAHTPWDWHGELFAKARDVGITMFSSPFDHTAVELLEELHAPAYKIASFEMIDLPLIARVAGTGKPIIISTGMGSRQEIAEAIDCARDNGAQEIAILHCVSGYPAPAEDYNLKMIADMMQQFGVPVGISDHTLDNVTAIGAVALGACLIEKHLTLDQTRGGPDDSFSIEPDALAALCRDARTVWQASGAVRYGPAESEKGNVAFRRSLYVVGDIEAGEIFDETNIRSIRPGYGLPPKSLPQVLGKRAARRLERGTALRWDYVEPE